MEMKKLLNFSEMKLHGFLGFLIVSGGTYLIILFQLLDVDSRFRQIVKKRAEVQPDLITYSTLLKGYCQVGHFGWLMLSELLMVLS